MSLELVLILGVAVLGAVVVMLLARAKRAKDAEEGAKRARDDLDTVTSWPPEATRLLTSGERSAREVLIKALPECMLFAQVPLARFIKVPRRHSYAEWLTRVGHLCADFVLCDRASMVIGVVVLQTARDSERSERRRVRMARVLKAAGVKVFQWREESLPSPETARDQIIQRVGEISTTPVVEIATPRPTRAGPPGAIPVPEVLAELPDDGQRREPPASTWFDDLDSGRVPLDPQQRPRTGEAGG
jgi:Protein of unknown function (DUF2726)